MRSIWSRSVVSCKIFPWATAVTVFAVIYLAGTGVGFCGTPESQGPPVSDAQADEGIRALILMLKAKGLLTEDEVTALRQRLEAGNISATETGGGAVPQFQDAGKLSDKIDETQEKLDKNVDNLLQRDRLVERRLDELERKVTEDVAGKQYKSSWAQKVKIGGDLRLRYQHDYKDKLNDERYGVDGNEPTHVDRERYRYRARLGVKAALLDAREKNVGKAEVGLRLATGNTDDPTSTNMTVGDYFNKDDFGIDRAYLDWKWKPIEQVWGGKLPQIGVTLGRMANPFVSTDLVWDGDVNFEGATLSLTSDVFEGNSWQVFVTAGAYPLEEYEFREEAKWLHGYQLGLTHKPFFGLNYKLSASYYDFKHVKGEPITTVPDYYYLDDILRWGEPGYSQGGNTVVNLNRVMASPLDDPIYGLAADYKLLNVTLMIDIDRFFPVHVILAGDYVTNIGYDKDEVRQRYDEDEVPDYQLDQTEGYQFGITLGYPKVRRAGEWSTSFFYKYLEADAVLDAFTDSDFNTGGTDAEGYIARIELGLYQNIWLTARYLSTNEIVEENGQFAVDTLQVDINAEF